MSILIARAIDSALDFGNPGDITKTLTVPAATLQDTAVVDTAFELPPAQGFTFDIANAGTIDNVAHTTTLAVLLQGLLPDGSTWQDYVYFLTANRGASRSLASLMVPVGPVGLSASANPVSSGGSATTLLQNSGASLNGASVVPALTSFSGVGLLPGFTRKFRLVGIPRVANPTVGDTITVKVTALVDPNEY